MNLGIFIYSLSGGGAERAVSHLLDYCSKNDISIHLILMSPAFSYDVPDNIKIHYVEETIGHENNLIKTLKIPILAYKYAKLAKRLRITHSLSFLTRPAFINILSRSFTSYKYKIITNERAFPSLQYGYKNFQSFFNKGMIKWLYKKSDLVISNSDGNAKDLVDNFEVPQSKMKVVNNPIDLNKISTINSVEGYFEHDKFNIITLGRLDIGKNHAMLIKAVAKLNNPEIRLYIFGSGNMKEELEILIKNLKIEDQIFLAGFDPNPYKHLKSADLFIFGSNHEGFPNVLLEAMSCGLPILTTNCKSGPKEILKLQKEKNDIMITDFGILVPIKNSHLMSKGIDYMFSEKDYFSSCKENVLKRAQDFEKNKILKEYIDVIKTLTPQTYNS